MSELFDRIKKDAETRILNQNDGNKDFLMYLDHAVFKKGDIINIISSEIKVEQNTYVIFVDDEPGKNFAHRCHYLLYDAEKGNFIKMVNAEFPYFLKKSPGTLELFRTCKTIEGYKRKKRMRIPLEPGKLSAYQKLAPLPLVSGRRYAILFSGASNGRHVNDMEFLYRTLIDVYGFNSTDIYILNYNGTLNYNTQPWETPAADGFGADGTPFRLVVNGAGNRDDFQDVIADIATRIKPQDLLFIHTNNHGGWDVARNEGYLVTLGNGYYTSDFGTDIATLPPFKTLLVNMEQCHSGAFSQSVLNNSNASNTVFQAAVPWDESSAGGWPFDPWAEMWISAMSGVRGDGSALAVSPDDNLNDRISAWEAYDYALHIDNPVMSESSVDISKNVYLSKTTIKLFKESKEIKEIKEIKEFKEPKEIKEFKESKEVKEFKEPKEIKEIKEPKEIYEGKHIKEFAEPKEIREGYEKITDTTDPVTRPKEWSEVIERIDRLEKSLSTIKPFIKSEERPNLNKKTSDEGSNQ